METAALALVVSEPIRRRRSKRVPAIAAPVTARSSVPAGDGELRAEMPGAALAECLYREIRALHEAPELNSEIERPTTAEEPQSAVLVFRPGPG
jgi:hypothetical protein